MISVDLKIKVSEEIKSLGSNGLVIYYEDIEIPLEFDNVSANLNDDILSIQLNSFNKDIYQLEYDELFENNNISVDDLSADLFKEQFTNDTSGQNYIDFVFEGISNATVESCTLTIKGVTVDIPGENITLSQRDFLI